MAPHPAGLPAAEFTCIDLCAGAHGLGLGVSIAIPLVFPGFRARSVCHVEREAFAAATLVGHMEAGTLDQAPVWSDLGTFDGRPWCGRVHCVTSGDPCQPNSVAGKRLGEEDDRFLADQVIRVVDEVRPLCVFRENVPGNADGQLRVLVPALEAMGYRVECGLFSSAETGNSHGRKRLIILADSDSENVSRRWSRGNAQGWQEPSGHAGLGIGAMDPIRHSAGCPPDILARGVPRPDNPVWPELLQSRPELIPAHSRYDRFAATVRDAGFAPDGRPLTRAWQKMAARVDARESLRSIREAIFQKAAQCHLRGSPDALAQRVDRLRLLGNGVDPVAAAYAWLCLDARHRDRAEREFHIRADEPAVRVA